MTNALWRVARPASPAEMIRVHEVGIKVPHPEQALLAFPEYRRLVPDQKFGIMTVFNKAARIADHWRGSSGAGWLHFPEMTDPANPLAFDRLVAGECGVTGGLIRLHFFLRAHLVLAAPGADGVSAPVSLHEWGIVTGFMDVYWNGTNGSGRVTSARWEKVWDDLDFLGANDPSSFACLARTLQGEGTPNRPFRNRILQTTARSANLDRRWPSSIEREGAAAAALHRGTRVEIRRLNTLKFPPGTATVSFHDDGTVIWRQADPLSEPVKRGSLTAAEGRRLAKWLAAVATNWKLNPRHTAKLLGAIKTLADVNPASLRTLARSAPYFSHNPKDLGTSYVMHAAAFCNKYRNLLEIEGPIIAFYYRNRGQSNEFKNLSKELATRRIAKVTFDENGQYTLMGHPPVSAGDGTRFSYAESVDFKVLPSPANAWCRDGFARSPRSVAREQKAFFQGLERRLEKRPQDLCREWGLAEFYKYRNGALLLPSRCLSDQFLDAQGLTAPEKEHLRHLQTLLAVAKDLRHEPHRGPGREAGLLVRYYRLLHGLTLQDVLNNLGSAAPGIEQISLMELGWRTERRAALLDRLTATLGVPRAIRGDFISCLMTVWDGVETRSRPFYPTGAAVSFPETGCDIPFYSWERRELHMAIQRWTRRLREKLGLTQVAMAQRLHLNVSKITEPEHRGGMGQVAFKAWVRYLTRRKGFEEEVQELRLLRGRIELLLCPVAEGGLLRPAGLLLRYARYLVPDLTARQLAQRLSTPERPVPCSTIQRAETGMDIMPLELRSALAQLLIAEGALTEDHAATVISRIQTIYRALGISNA